MLEGVTVPTEADSLFNKVEELKKVGMPEGRAIFNVLHAEFNQKFEGLIRAIEGRR